MSVVDDDTAVVMAGVPQINAYLYRRIRFSVGDPVAVIDFPVVHGHPQRSLLILRDIEIERAQQHARVSEVGCPAHFTPSDGLSGDRETATAQATAEALCEAGISRVTSDRTLPLIFAEMMRRRGIEVNCDIEMGVAERRSKDEQELALLREAQEATEGAMEMACRLVATADTNASGILQWQGADLTAEILRAQIDQWLSQRGYSTPTPIVACGPVGADCHDHGSGVLRTELPIIVDIFPQNRETMYNGDCTRTVVHGKISSTLEKMHTAVAAAKAAAIDVTRPGVTGEEVHLATKGMMEQQGFQMGLPDKNADDSYCAMTHGTGHGIGLEVHEPPLLDYKGPKLVKGDVLTIEPGLYCKSIGGIRLEDMVAVTDDGCVNFNSLQESMDWS